MDTLRRIETPRLTIACYESGPPDGPPVLLMHGFPYAPDAYAEVAPRLAAAGCRVLVPYLRGYGPTRFRDGAVPRSGEQAVLGEDLLALLTALDLGPALLAGFDWGGRAACIVAALWPERVKGLVTVDGYNLQDIARSGRPASPDYEQRYWYQYYFHSERGRAGLAANRDEIARLLWRLWSPDWAFDEATFARSAAAFDNPDYVEVVIHSYRHRFGLVPGDPAVAAIEARLAAQPAIGVPTIALHGESDGVAGPSDPVAEAKHFTGPFERRSLPRVGHNPPQEAPEAFATAILDLLR